ncbi:MAG: hypothetical protein F6K26_31360 [Moorea sp. SIO2I5]|nr:hypothetical protein [Moorena sp. SIO2I5]
MESSLFSLACCLLPVACCLLPVACSMFPKTQRKICTSPNLKPLYLKP